MIAAPFESSLLNKKQKEKNKERKHKPFTFWGPEKGSLEKLDLATWNWRPPSNKSYVSCSMCSFKFGGRVLCSEGMDYKDCN